MENQSPLIIYHGNCADGFTAAWAAWKKFGSNAEYFAGIYGQPPPDCRSRDVYIVDFSYSLDVMLDIKRDCNLLVLLDHHVTAKPVYDELVRMREAKEINNFAGVFSLEESGALLTWQWFHPGVKIPNLVAIVSDRDLWQFKLPDTREFMASIFSYEYTFDNWNELYEELEFSHGRIKHFNAGAAIERKHHKDVAELVEALRIKIKIGTDVVYACSLPYTLTSDAGHLLCDYGVYGVCFWYTKHGVVLSLRSRNDSDVDVGAIAKAYGGGGHKNAAGFTVTPQQFLEMQYIVQ